MPMVEQMRNMVATMIKPLRNRLYNVISRAGLEAANDSGQMQVLKVSVLAGENRDDVEHFQEYGFTSRAKAGAECLIVCPQGNREHMIALKVGDRTVRLKGLAEGDVAMFDDAGNKIHLKQDGSIEVVSPLKVLITSPETEMSGNLTVKGTSKLEGAVNADETITALGEITGAGVVSTAAITAAAGTVTGLAVATSGGVDLDDVKTKYNMHKHNENGTGGGITDTPDSPL